MPVIREVHDSWSGFFESQQSQLDEIFSHLDFANVTPAPDDIFKVFRYSAIEIRVAIIGQDPYPKPGDANGLAFSSNAQVMPMSLRNIFQELATDTASPLRDNPDLSDWAEQGVFLVNRVLTTRPGESLAHKAIGWENFTFAALQYLAELNPNLVVILWGNKAQELRSLFNPNLLIESVHPSPLSAHRGFFGSKPFSRANHQLEQLGLSPIRWG